MDPIFIYREVSMGRPSFWFMGTFVVLALMWKCGFYASGIFLSFFHSPIPITFVSRPTTTLRSFSWKKYFSITRKTYKLIAMVIRCCFAVLYRADFSFFFMWHYNYKEPKIFFSLNKFKFSQMVFYGNQSTWEHTIHHDIPLNPFFNSLLSSFPTLKGG